MNIIGLIILAVTGGTIGWLTGAFIKGWSIGVFGDIFIGIIGGVAGGLLYRLLVIASRGGIFVSMITAALGAIGLQYVIGLLKYPKSSPVK